MNVTKLVQTKLKKVDLKSKSQITINRKYFSANRINQFLNLLKKQTFEIEYQESNKTLLINYVNGFALFHNEEKREAKNVRC
jgi:hypothetical protein